MSRNWLAVASADHVAIGRRGGFMQVCHGKLAPIRRVHPGDRVAYYAPTLTLGGRQACQCFVSVGLVQPGEPYAFDMGGGFVPYRRDVAFVSGREAPIQPLLDDFDFVEDRQRWGYKFRFGLFEVSDHDMRLIADAMEVPRVLLHLQ